MYESKYHYLQLQCACIYKTLTSEIMVSICKNNMDMFLHNPFELYFAKIVK